MLLNLLLKINHFFRIQLQALIPLLSLQCRLESMSIPAFPLFLIKRESNLIKIAISFYFIIGNPGADCYLQLFETLQLLQNTITLNVHAAEQ